MDLERLLARIRSLGIPELSNVSCLTKLPGTYLNLVCRLPNGKTDQILDERQDYWACQVEKIQGDCCIGVACNLDMIAVYEYKEQGQDAVLRLWKKI